MKPLMENRCFTALRRTIARIVLMVHSRSLRLAAGADDQGLIKKSLACSRREGSLRSHCARFHHFKRDRISRTWRGRVVRNAASIVHGRPLQSNAIFATSKPDIWKKSYKFDLCQLFCGFTLLLVRSLNYHASDRYGIATLAALGIARHPCHGFQPSSSFHG